MTRAAFKSLVLLFGFIIVASLPARLSPQTPPATVPVSMIVSVEAKNGTAVPVIYREDVRALQGNKRLQVTDWVALQGDHAELQLFVLIDDAIKSSVSVQFDDVRQFMDAQPGSTSIAVGYMQHGSIEIAQDFTKDHGRAGKALRMPMGSTGMSPSPYLSISDAMKSWPDSQARREMLIVSSGIDRLGTGPGDPYLTAAIEQAQRAGIQVYAIYAEGMGHLGHSFWRFNWGQINLGQLTDETGGEFYIQGMQAPIDFKPYLDAFADRLQHQYLVTFLAVPEKKASYQNIRFETEVSNAEIVAADRVFVPTEK